MKNYILTLLIVCFSLTGRSQILNASMETYTHTPFDTLPTNWMVKSYFGSLRGQTTDAHSGNYAFAINSWYYYGMDMMINGEIDPAYIPSYWIKAGSGISTKPTKLKGFYKYTETLVTDSAIVEVILKKWNTSKNRQDTISYGDARLHPTANYIEFEVEIKDIITTIQPDSIVIKFTSHDPKNLGMPANGNSRYLYIDDLSLEHPVGINESKKDKSINCFYANNELNVSNKEMKSFSLSVYSTDGKLLLSKDIKEAENKVSMAYLPKGVYIIKTKGEVNLQQKFFKD